MSKQNHLRPYEKLATEFPTKREKFDAHTKILPLEAILTMKGLDSPDIKLSKEDREILLKMGIVVD